MRTSLLVVVVAFVVMEIISFRVYRNADIQEKTPFNVNELSAQKSTYNKTEASKVGEKEAISIVSDVTDAESFPPPSTEVVNGKTERTIHIGVRQYIWEPAVLTAKKNERVRLIVHNADVKHGLVIPDLGVNQDIPPDGAVVEFSADKAGTFEFFCSVWCGEGHMEMRGKIIIE